MLLAVTAGLAGCQRGGAPAGPGGPGGGAMPPMPVTVAAAVPRKVPVVIEAVATLEGLREVEVRARVGGTLQQQLVREGEPVAAGAVLYRIDREPLEIAVDAARAALAQAEARVEQARREAARLAPLVAERAISQREADDAASNARSADAALAAARAQLRQAQLDLSHTDVTAPVAGVAQRSLRSVGSLLAPGTDAALLTTLVQLDPIRVRFALAEDEAAKVRASRERRLRLLGPDGQPSTQLGRIDFSASAVDPRLGTVAMRAEIANADGRWLPGQFVRAQVLVGEQDAFLVPQAAVMSGEQGRFVWIMGADGKAQPRPVQTGGWQGSDWIIRSGLAAGDRVIVDNLLKLRPGAPVQPAAAGGPGAPGGPGGAGGATAPPQPGSAPPAAQPGSAPPAAQSGSPPPAASGPTAQRPASR